MRRGRRLGEGAAGGGGDNGQGEGGTTGKSDKAAGTQVNGGDQQKEDTAEGQRAWHPGQQWAQTGGSAHRNQSLEDERMGQIDPEGHVRRGLQAATASVADA